MLGERGGDDVSRWIGLFQDSKDDGRYPWLGRRIGWALGVGLVIVVLGTALAPAVVVVYSGSALFAKLVCALWLTVAMFTLAYWRRQRLAAHFQAAHRCLGSADPAERQRGLVDMMVNARRGQAEHWRIARDLAGYLRAAPLDAPDEPGRRQFAFTMLADQTLVMAAKQLLDLSGAMLAGIRGVGAELPGARLCGADLTGAHLARANLENADLRQARLEGADLTGARLGVTFAR
jgi:hypothetical protein